MMSANPRIGMDARAHGTAKKQQEGDIQRLALDVPQGLVETAQRRHQDWPAAIKAAAKSDLPDVFDARGVVSDETIAKARERALDRLGMTLKARLAPAGEPFRLHADEKPTGPNKEGIHHPERYG